jgi:hypothetical protein
VTTVWGPHPSSCSCHLQIIFPSLASFLLAKIKLRMNLFDAPKMLPNSVCQVLLLKTLVFWCKHQVDIVFHDHITLLVDYLFILVVPGFELSVSCLLDRCFTTWATLPAQQLVFCRVKRQHFFWIMCLVLEMNITYFFLECNSRTFILYSWASGFILFLIQPAVPPALDLTSSRNC